MQSRPTLDPATVVSKLRKLYNPPVTFLHFRTPLDLVVVTILSARCTDLRVNIVSEALFRKYSTVHDYLSVPLEELERDIRSCGTYRRKAKHIRTLARILKESHRGRVPDTMEELIKLPGVGRKTANIILKAAFGRVEGIAVDTHVARVARRTGLTDHAHPEKIEIELMRTFPKRDWGRINTLFISHGRAVCAAKRRACDRCVFALDCPSSWVQGRRDRAGQDQRSRPS